MFKRKFFVISSIFLLLFGFFAGCIGGDSDGDNLSYLFENEGWEITIFNIDGTTQQKIVKSDPNRIDTDNDGINDYDEMLMGSDPSKKDTDNDGLLDNEEKDYGTSSKHFDSWIITVGGENQRVYAKYAESYSSPTLYDSDGDRLSDSNEYYLGIDPSDVDTDDDGTDDYLDPEPLWNLKIEVTLDDFLLKKNKDSVGGADLYFIINAGEESYTTTTWDTSLDINEQLNFVRILDFSDINAFDSTIEIMISALDEDSGGPTYHDVIKINDSSSIYKIYFDINESQKVDIKTEGVEGYLNFSLEIIKT
jgi:hypothetical protein